MDVKCSQCESPDARIWYDRIPFCLNCYNNMIADDYGLDPIDKENCFVILDNEGKCFIFNIEGMIMGDNVFWTALEQIDDNQTVDYEGLEFAVVVPIGTEQEEAVNLLYEKTLKGVCEKSLGIIGADENDVIFSNSVQRNSKQYSLEGLGIARIEEDSYGKPYMVIDGHRFSGEEFLLMATVYCGFDMRWEFVDKA